MIRKILLAADGAEARRVVGAVVDLAQTAGDAVEVEVLHVNEVEYQTSGNGHADEPDLNAQAQELVDELVDELRDRGVNARGCVRSGVYDDVADDIVAEARDQRAGLIVVGCGSRSDLSCWIRGSVSHAVVRRAPCPVLVVRETVAPF